MVERDIQLIEDSEAADLEKEEEENASEALKAIRRRKQALEWRISLERNKVLDPDSPPERIEEAKKKLAELQESYAKINEEEKVFQTKLGEKSAALENEIKNLQMDREELEKANKEDTEILNDENSTPEEKQAARERIETHNEELDGERSTLERVKDVFKKYGQTLTAIIIAAGTTIGAVIGVLTRGLKATGKAMGNGLKELGKKIASILPGLLGAIVSFLFKAAGKVIGFFLAEHTWLLILAVVVFLFETYLKKRR